MSPDLVRTIPASHDSLLDALPDGVPLASWVRGGMGIVGLGEAYSMTFNSSREAREWWTDLCARAMVDVEAVADEPMSGPLAFVSFPFSLDGSYELVVPRRVVGLSRQGAWATTWDTGDALSDSDPLTWEPSEYRSPRVTMSGGALDERAWKNAVGEALDRIRAGVVEKVVLARDECGTSPDPIDLRALLARLQTSYPQTWAFCVKGLVGATPELLVRRDRGLVTSRVLAGTIHGDRDPRRLAEALTSSSKDLGEHEYAVASVAEALRPHVTSLHVPEIPFTLSLPNVMHLASDITGAAKPNSTVLELAEAIHPSAAVCGTPTDAARAVIAELESFDRGRYAGPVGWINAAGDGEIGISLRCGHVSGAMVQIFAGAGIVADSDPDAEWEETQAKMLPMRQALGVETA